MPGLPGQDPPAHQNAGEPLRQNLQIGAILGRLSCKRRSIGGRKVHPGEVWLIDRPGHRDIWDVEGWAVQLIGEAVTRAV